MQLDAILEVAIGLVFVWIVLSVATMEIQNWVGQRLEWRAKFLEQSILEMFKNEQALVDQFYNHPAIVELSKLDKKGKLKKPEHIPNLVFAEVALEILLNAGKKGEEVQPEAMSFDVMASSVEETKAISPDLSRLMDRLFPKLEQEAGAGISFGLEQVESKVAEYRENVEKWFDNVMSQASAWYKQSAQAWAFGIGLALAFIFNIDTIFITQQLWREPTVRGALIAQADTFQVDEGTESIAKVPGYFDSLAIPVGWTLVPAIEPSSCDHRFTGDGRLALWVGSECKVLVNVPPINDIFGWIIKLFGFVVSAFAARQGAPFWFDILKKLVSVRTVIKPSEGEAKG